MRRVRASKLSVTDFVVMGLKPSGLTPKPPEESRQDASVEFNVHSFIVKVWLVKDATKNRGKTWQGHITHVPSGEKRDLTNLGEITAFIEPYLKAMGIRFGPNE